MDYTSDELIGKVPVSDFIEDNSIILISLHTDEVELVDKDFQCAVSKTAPYRWVPYNSMRIESISVY